MDYRVGDKLVIMDYAIEGGSGSGCSSGGTWQTQTLLRQGKEIQRRFHFFGYNSMDMSGEASFDLLLMVYDLASNNKKLNRKTWDDLSNKRIYLLDKRIQTKVIDFINYSLSNGIKLRITQGLRTKEEQDLLYALGRTSPGNIVTYAKGGESYHNYGLAFVVVEILKRESQLGC